MILVDPPQWPAHGTVFGHLASDTSMVELHRFADRIELSPRAYDRDHYDLPVSRYDDAVNAGARQVTAAELAAAVRAAGLRRPKPVARARARQRMARLREGWARLLPRAPDLGEELVARWSQEHRRYHTLQHLDEMLARLAELDQGTPRAPALAAWFHDAVHEGEAGADEEASARLAEERLDGLLPSAEVAWVAALVRLSAGHDPEAFDPGDDAARLWDPRTAEAFVDADLAILGASPPRYLDYARQVRAEYYRVPTEEFRAGRLAVLDDLTSRRRLYRTAAAASWWTAHAHDNMARERDFLQSR